MEYVFLNLFIDTIKLLFTIYLAVLTILTA